MTEKKKTLSRIGKRPVALPDKVSVNIDGKNVSVKGPKGQLQRTFTGVRFEQVDNTIVVYSSLETKHGKALHGLGRALLQNMVTGVSVGYKKELKVVGVGYRIDLSGSTLTLQVGYSHQVKFNLPTGVKGDVQGQTALTLESIDKQLVGEVAAQIRSIRPPEPYKGKGIRYADEYIRRKAGKSALKA
jgi:large subunit ribosomal protein L6